MELNQVWEDFLTDLNIVQSVMEASRHIHIYMDSCRNLRSFCFSKITWNQVQVFPTQSPEGFYQQFGAVPACNCKIKKKCNIQNINS